MHDDKFDKGYNYDAMRRHHGPEDPYDYPSHGHRHPAYDFPDVYHPVPYGKEYLGNQPIHLQNPHNGHIVHPCPPRDWGRHGCPPEEHHHCHEPMHVPPMKDYLSEYVGLLEDYFHKDKGLDDCDCGEAIRHLRDEINALLKAMGRDLNELGNEYDSIKSKLAYYIGKTQACIQSTEEYMRRQEYIGTDWEEMKATFQAVIDEWEAIDAISVIDYFLEGETVVDKPTVDELIEAYISDMPAITTLNWVNRVENSDELTETQLSEYSRVVYHYNEPTVGTSIEFTTFLKDNDTYNDNVHGNYLVLVDRIEVVEECEDKKVLEHAEKWARTEGYPQLHTLKDYSQGTTDKAVKTRMIDDGAVTSAKIGSKAVTTGKIDDGAVETDKIADKNVTEGKLSDDVVRKLNKDDDTKYTLTKDGNTITLTGSDGSVTSVTDKDEDHNTTYTLSKTGNTITLTGSDGSTTSVTDDDEDTVFVLEDGSVTTDKLSNGAVSEEKLSSAVREKLNNDNDTTYALSKSGSTITLTGSDGSTTSVTDSSGTSGISDGEVTTIKLADGAVTTDKLANQSVTTAKIADDAITYSELAPSAVRTAILQDGAVTNAKINNGAVSEEKLASAVQTKLNRTYSVVNGSDDGLMSSDMYRKLNTLETPTVDILTLNNTNFTGYIDCVKTGGICSIITRDDCESKVSFNPNTWYDIGQLASGFRPTRGFYTPVTLGQFTGRVWCDSLGNLKILISADSSVTTIPSTLRLAFNAVFSHE